MLVQYLRYDKALADFSVSIAWQLYITCHVWLQVVSPGGHSFI